jgi:hypothetical protein
MTLVLLTCHLLGCSILTADVDESCPSRGRCAVFAKFGDGSIKRASDVVEVGCLPCEEGLVKFTRNGWYVVVAHYPAGVHVIVSRNTSRT